MYLPIFYMYIYNYIFIIVYILFIISHKDETNIDEINFIRSKAKNIRTIIIVYFALYTDKLLDTVVTLILLLLIK